MLSMYDKAMPPYMGCDRSQWYLKKNEYIVLPLHRADCDRLLIQKFEIAAELWKRTPSRTKPCPSHK